MYVTVHCENIVDQVESGVSVKAVCPSTTSTKCQGWGCAFEKMPNTFADYSTPYDVHSLLHYRSTAFCDPKSCKQTITGVGSIPDPVDGVAPSLGDALRICELYADECVGVGVCGNGIVDPYEQCDDGNNIDGDGCSANCRLEPRCGNGIIDPGEDCDDGPRNGQYGFLCNANCKKVDPKACPLETCDPRPGKNRCHSTSTCIRIEDSLAWTSTPTFLCACQAGFRGKGVIPGELNKEIRIPGSQWPSQRGRAFVKPGIECTEMCFDWTLGADGCKEVSTSDLCFKP